MTSTKEVLEFIGDRGVVVGSVAAGKLDPKDVDVVMNPSPVFARKVIAAFPDFKSACMEHCWIDAFPVPVEIHTGTLFALKDVTKVQLSHRRAKKTAVRKMVYGVEMWVTT